MNTLLVLQNRAIKAAQEERWQDAQDSNLEILSMEPENVSARNRLGFAYLQMGEKVKATEIYKQVLERDKTNAVAKKYLRLIEKSAKQPVKLPKALRHTDFIDEPGKTKSVPLVRLADANVLEELSVGAECFLHVTKTRISVQVEKKYIGTLPDDIFLRLQPLVEAGNTYSVKIQSVRANSVRVFIRELTRALSVEHMQSFPTDSTLNDLDHSEIAREDDSPMRVGAAGEDGDDQMLDSADIDEALEEDEFLDDDDDVLPDDDGGDDSE